VDITLTPQQGPSDMHAPPLMLDHLSPFLPNDGGYSLPTGLGSLLGTPLLPGAGLMPVHEGMGMREGEDLEYTNFEEVFGGQREAAMMDNGLPPLPSSPSLRPMVYRFTSDETIPSVASSSDWNNGEHFFYRNGHHGYGERSGPVLLVGVGEGGFWFAC
jgi:hypothetical protein